MMLVFTSTHSSMLTEDFSSAVSSSSSSSSPGPEVKFITYHQPQHKNEGPHLEKYWHQICQTFEFTEVESFVFRSKLDGLAKEVLNVESVHLHNVLTLNI